MTELGPDAVTKMGFYGSTPVRIATADVYDREQSDPLMSVTVALDGTALVEMPHQCDEWCVAWGSRDEAVVMMNAFIGSALDALARLQSAEPGTKS